MEKMSPKIVGDIQMTREGEISAAANSVMSPKRVCARWRRAMLLSGIEPSSRRCGFQPVSRPDRICATDPDWISIMIAENAADMMISTIVEAMSASAPPEPRRVLARAQSRPGTWRHGDADRQSNRQRAVIVEERGQAETGRIPW